MTAPEPIVSLAARDAVSRRAAVFFERRHFGEWTGADQAEFDAWLAESVFHRVAYLRVEGAVAHAGRLVAFRRSFRRAPGGTGRLASYYRLLALPLLAAAFAALGIWGFPLVESLMQPPERSFSTDIGGRTMLSFADRTQIELNTDTAIRFRMTNKERIVWLERGEAWFHVAHNAADPFTLFVGNHRVTDLGTEFVVRRGANRLVVALLQGRAALTTQGAPTATLAAGEEAVAAGASVSIIRKSPQELADELAWRRGKLVFRNTRLADVVKEFNRYNATKLVIADPAIAGEKINGDAKTDDYEGFLQLVEVALKLHVERDGNDILIFRRTGNETKRAGRAGRSSSEAVAQ